MALRMRVKVGGITNLSEARYCAGMGCDYLGFRVGGKGLSPNEFREIAGWVPGPQLVVEVDHLENPEEVTGVLSELMPPLVQVEPDQIAIVSAGPRLVIRATDSLDDYTSRLVALRHRIEALILARSVGAAVAMRLAEVFVCLIHSPDYEPPGWPAHSALGLDLPGRTESAIGLVDNMKLSDLLESLEVPV
jgi:phosphoribosylanthranilate isomerase